MTLSMLLTLSPAAYAFLPGLTGRFGDASSTRTNPTMYDAGDLTDMAKLVNMLSTVDPLDAEGMPDLLEEFRSEILKRDLLVERLIDESVTLLPLDADAGSMLLDEHVEDFSISVSTGGLPKEELHVSIESNVLTVEGDTRGEEPGRSWRSSFSRSLSLPLDADWQSPDVRVVQDRQRGALIVRIPRAPTALSQGRVASRRVLQVEPNAAITAGEAESEREMLTDADDSESDETLMPMPGLTDDEGLSEAPNQRRESYVGRRRILRGL